MVITKKCVGLQVCRGTEKTESRRSKRFVEQNDPLSLLTSRDPNHVSTAVQPVAYLLPRLRYSRSAQCCFDAKFSNSPLINLKSPIWASNSTKTPYKFTATCEWNFSSRLLKLIHIHHAVPLPCPSAISHTPWCAAGMFWQCRVLRESVRGSRRNPNC